MCHRELDIEDQVIVALRRITRAIDLRSRGLFQEHGLTAPQLAALRAIGKMHRVSLGHLAKAIHLSLPTVNGILKRLERQSLVSRSRSEEDRRAVVVELTPEGTRVLDSAPSLLQDRFRHELARLPQWQRTQILCVLQHIAAMMDAEEIEAVPVLTPGAAVAAAEDVSRYLERAVTIPEDPPVGSSQENGNGTPEPDPTRP